MAKVLNYFNKYLSSAYAVFQSRKARQVFDKIMIETRMYERTLVSEGVDKEVALARQRSQQGGLPRLFTAIRHYIAHTRVARVIIQTAP